MANEHWFTPELSLPRQLEREIDRRHAARMDRNDLSVLVDKLIVDWYRQNELVDRLLGKVRQLQVEVALSSAPPTKPDVSEDHLLMAKELREQLGID